jgi:hypothetical protein
MSVKAEVRPTPRPMSDWRPRVLVPTTTASAKQVPNLIVVGLIQGFPKQGAYVKIMTSVDVRQAVCHNLTQLPELAFSLDLLNSCTIDLQGVLNPAIQ